MDDGELVNELFLLRAWRQVQRVLREAGVGGRLSWEDLSTHLDGPDGDAVRAILKSLLGEMRLFGDKEATLVSVPREVRAGIGEIPAELTHSDVAEIAEADGAEPEFVGAIRDRSGTTLVWKSLKHVQDRQPIQREWWSEDHLEILDAAKEAYLVQLYEVVAVECVEVPAGNRHGNVRTVHRTRDGTVVAEERTTVDALLERTLSASGATDPPVPLDLFPAVRNIYLDDTEGNVRAMNFDCPTGVNRRETMKRTSQDGAERDLRRELYHRGGMEALQGQQDRIEPFRITVEWLDVPDAGTVEMTLPGVRRMLVQPERPRLTVARINMPLGSAGYRYALERLAYQLRNAP